MAGLISEADAKLETCPVALYEYQIYAGKGEWSMDPKMPWLCVDLTPSVPPDEINLPDSDWSWISNWKYDVRQNFTDRHGWEYA